MKLRLVPAALAALPAIAATASAATWSIDLSAPKADVFAASAAAAEPGFEAARRAADGPLRRVEPDRSTMQGLGGGFAPGDTLAFTFFDGEVRRFRVE